MAKQHFPQSCSGFVCHVWSGSGLRRSFAVSGAWLLSENAPALSPAAWLPAWASGAWPFLWRCPSPTHTPPCLFHLWSPAWGWGRWHRESDPTQTNIHRLSLPVETNQMWDSAPKSCGLQPHRRGQSRAPREGPWRQPRQVLSPTPGGDQLQWPGFSYSDSSTIVLPQLPKSI